MSRGVVVTTWRGERRSGEKRRSSVDVVGGGGEGVSESRRRRNRDFEGGRIAVTLVMVVAKNRRRQSLTQGRWLFPTRYPADDEVAHARDVKTNGRLRQSLRGLETGRPREADGRATGLLRTPGRPRLPRSEISRLPRSRLSHVVRRDARP